MKDYQVETRIRRYDRLKRELLVLIEILVVEPRQLVCAQVFLQKITFWILML